MDAIHLHLFISGLRQETFFVYTFVTSDWSVQQIRNKKKNTDMDVD